MPAKHDLIGVLRGQANHAESKRPNAIRVSGAAPRNRNPRLLT